MPSDRPSSAAPRPIGDVLDLTGRTALITGGSRGLGYAIAERFLAAGAAVALVARRADVLAEAKSTLERNAAGRVHVYPCNVADAGEVDALCAALTRDRQRIDVLVNNAGASKRGPFETLTDADWRDDFELKLFAAIRLARFVLPGMKERRWGRILNVVSINGKTPGAEGAPTCISRAAGIALTKVLAGEFAPFNVLVNALCTGVIMSDQIERRYEANGKGMSFEDYAKLEAKPIPLGRVGEAEEYANVALMLASEAGSYVTGAAINIDGGLCKVV